MANFVEADEELEHCPICGSLHHKVTQMTITDSATIEVTKYCDTCEQSWTEVYTLSGHIIPE